MSKALTRVVLASVTQLLKAKQTPNPREKKRAQETHTKKNLKTKTLSGTHCATLLTAFFHVTKDEEKTATLKKPVSSAASPKGKKNVTVHTFGAMTLKETRLAPRLAEKKTPPKQKKSEWVLKIRKPSHT